MNCDRLAPWYQACEFAAFGRALERHRFHFIERAPIVGNALLIGDGDGRFLVQLAKARPLLHIRSVDASGRMVQIARNRLASIIRRNASRITVEHEDACNASFESEHYDLVVTNFFFDCLQNNRLQDFVTRLAHSTRAGALWIVTEFQRPQRGWRHWHARTWLAVMYLFFRMTTGLRTCELPDHTPALSDAHFHRIASYSSRGGLIVSELWRRV